MVSPAVRRMDQGQPKRKKIRLEEEDKVTGGEDQRRNHQKTQITSPKKRKENRGADKPAKKARPNYDIKRYITCRRWKEQESEEGKEKEGE